MMHNEQKIVNEIFVLIPNKHDGLLDDGLYV